MTDLMRWMYDHYIKDQVESQPKDAGEAMQLNLLQNDLDPEMGLVLQNVLSYYTVQGFRLGVRTALALQPDL